MSQDGKAKTTSGIGVTVVRKNPPPAKAWPYVVAAAVTALAAVAAKVFWR